MNDLVKNLLLWVVVAVVLMVIFQSFSPRTGAGGQDVQYSQFMEQVRRDQISSVKIAEDERTITFQTRGGQSGTVIAPRRDDRMIDDLIRAQTTAQIVNALVQPGQLGPGALINCQSQLLTEPQALRRIARMSGSVTPSRDTPSA